MATVSIVIPTYNRLDRLKLALAAIELQTYSPDKLQIVIVSDGSTDGTDEYLETLRSSLNLVFIPQSNAGPAAARNNGIKHATGEYILFMDDDIIPAPNLVAEHMRLHIAQPDRVVLGPMLSPKGFRMSPWVTWEQAMLEKQYAAMQMGKWQATARQFYTGNTSLARHFLLAVGGFDQRFRRAEDVELAYRLAHQGVEFIFNPQAIGYHYAERSFRSWLETPYAYGRNDVIFAHEHERWLLKAIREEFGYRNQIIRMLIWISLDRPRLSQSIQQFLKNAADLGFLLGSKLITRAGYSAIFNMRYYQGVADELGSRAIFYSNIQPRTASTTTKL
jgi:GT2 family glycosyltransferase